MVSGDVDGDTDVDVVICVPGRAVRAMRMQCCHRCCAPGRFTVGKSWRCGWLIDNDPFSRNICLKLFPDNIPASMPLLQYKNHLFAHGHTLTRFLTASTYYGGPFLAHLTRPPHASIREVLVKASLA